MDGPLGPKVGLITTMSPDETWPESFVRAIDDQRPRLHSALCARGLAVLDCGHMARTNSEMTAQGRELHARGAEVLIIYVGTWTYSNTAVSAAMEAGLPVVVWANATVGMFGIVGASIVKGALDEVGVHSTLVYGDADDPKTLDEVEMLCRAWAAATRLRGQTYGVGGSRCMGMYTAAIDPNEWRTRFGVDVDGFEQVEVIERAKARPVSEAADFLDWMRTEFGRIEPRDEVMLAQIQLYLTLKELIRERHYDFIAVKCLPELPSYHTTFCVAHALLNDSSDAYGQKEPFVCACEADSNGALTMQMLKHVSGSPVLFADFLHLDITDNMVRLCNCGSQPTDLAPSRKDVHWLTEGLREFRWKLGGACPQYVAKQGRVTLARLGRVKGRYIMLIATGEALELPREKLREINWQQPQAFVKLDCDIQRLIKSVRSNHIHMVYGDYSRHLRELCSVLDIEPVVP